MDLEDNNNIGYTRLKGTPVNFRKDRGFILGCLRINPAALCEIDHALSCDPNFLLEAIQANVEVLRYISVNFRNNPRFMLRAIACNAKAIQYADSRLFNNLSFSWKAMHKNPRILRFASRLFLMAQVYAVKNYFFNQIKRTYASLIGIMQRFIQYSHKAIQPITLMPKMRMDKELFVATATDIKEFLKLEKLLSFNASLVHPKNNLENLPQDWHLPHAILQLSNQAIAMTQLALTNATLMHVASATTFYFATWVSAELNPLGISGYMMVSETTCQGRLRVLSRDMQPVKY